MCHECGGKPKRASDAVSSPYEHLPNPALLFPAEQKYHPSPPGTFHSPLYLFSPVVIPAPHFNGDPVPSLVWRKLIVAALKDVPAGPFVGAVVGIGRGLAVVAGARRSGRVISGVVVYEDARRARHGEF